MLNGLIKNIVVKSVVTVLLSTSTVGNTTTETKIVEDIDNDTKIEEMTIEEETEMATEEEVIEEENIYEWNDEIIAEEIVNNPNFEEQYNELMDVYNHYNELMGKTSPNYMKEQHKQVKDEWRKEWVNQLYAMELDENSILNELRTSLISLVKLDYGYENCSDIISRINNNL